MIRIAMMAGALLALAAPVEAAAARSGLITLEGRTTHPVLRNASIQFEGWVMSRIVQDTLFSDRFSQ